ncbi:cysteate synthase [Candidatus Bipolaricaulota bacterium]|nr:cysteate synthase [Candidatus Bipolaricaulota bacterium]
MDTVRDDGSEAKSHPDVVCTGCGKHYPIGTLQCSECPDALLRSHYDRSTFRVTEASGIFRFADWLPCRHNIECAVGPTCYPSDGLARRLGLKHLFVGFNGYAPEVGASNPTGSFKDFEALPTLLLLRELGEECVVLASAGNTARAFAYAATLLDFPVILVVPEAMKHMLWLPIEPSACVRLVVVADSKDYALAISLSEQIAEHLAFPMEGGARNVARRDGMGTAVLEFAARHQAIPDHYVQAVGSGTGAIAAWEASQRLIAAGIGTRPPKLHLAQNAPFSPIHDAWSTRRSIRVPRAAVDLARQRELISHVDAEVLANRTPPYAVRGGVRDALTGSDGSTYSVTNAELRAARVLFERSERLPIGPAASVAVAALVQAVETGRIRRKDSVLLNITGNGSRLVRRDFPLYEIPVARRILGETLSGSEIDFLAVPMAGGV